MGFVHSRHADDPNHRGRDRDADDAGVDPGQMSHWPVSDDPLIVLPPDAPVEPQGQLI